MDNTSQQVRCLTVSQEQIMVYLPPTLPHDKAVTMVENILEVGTNNHVFKYSKISEHRTSVLDK